MEYNRISPDEIARQLGERLSCNSVYRRKSTFWEIVAFATLVIGTLVSPPLAIVAFIPMYIARMAMQTWICRTTVELQQVLGQLAVKYGSPEKGPSEGQMRAFMEAFERSKSRALFASNWRLLVVLLLALGHGVGVTLVVWAILFAGIYGETRPLITAAGNILVELALIINGAKTRSATIVL